MNKNLLSLIIFVTAISLSQVVSAQSQSSIMLWGMGDYGNWRQTENKALKPQNIYGGGIGIGYENWQKALILGIGAEVNFHKMNMTYDNFSIHRDSLMDDENDFYQGNFYYFYTTDLEVSNIEEKTNYANLQIPLYVGLQNRFLYALAGVKIAMNVYGTTTINYNRKSTGGYYMFFDDFEEMPNHGFYTVEKGTLKNIRFATTFIGTFEAGFKFPVQDENNKKPVTFRLGAFVDYSLNNMLIPNKTSFIYDEAASINLGYPVYQPVLNSLLLSNETSKMKIQPLMFGVKLSVVFRLKNKGLCNCNWD